MDVVYYMDIKCNSCDNDAVVIHGRRFLCLHCWNEIKETSQQQRNDIQ
jgi:hypothetical protein